MSRFTSLLATVHPRVYAWLAGAAVTVTVVGAAYLVASPRLLAVPAIQLNLRDGQAEVPLDQKLVFQFAHPVNLQEVQVAFHLRPATDGALALGTDNQSATFTPAAPWADLTDYSVNLDAMKSTSGRGLSARSWHFRTTVVPRILSVTTAAGIVLTPGAEVALGAPVRAVFNTSMDTASVRMTVNQKPITLEWPAGSRSANLSTAGIPAGPLAIAFADGRDQAGHLAPAGFHIDLNLAYQNPEKTTALKYPALVQIDNVPAARDQSGLQSADIVFEYLTEGGITRFTALFSSAPENVGPVRSGRYISFKLVRHYRGALFLSGLSTPSTKRLASDPVPVFFDAPYYRTNDRLAPENLYITGAGILTAENAGKPTPFVLPHAVPRFPGPPVAGIDLAVPEHNSTYAYDANTATYGKTEEGHLMADALLSQPLKVGLVIVVHTRETVTKEIEDVDGAHARDFETEAGGKAEFYYHGQAAQGSWSAPDRTSPWVFRVASGETVTLPRGLTWIDVVS